MLHEAVARSVSGIVAINYTSGFVDDVKFAHIRRLSARQGDVYRAIVKVSPQRAAPGAKCDVFDCLVHR